MKLSVGIFNSSYKIPEKKDANPTVIKVVREGIHSKSKLFTESSFLLLIKIEAINNSVMVMLKKIKIF